MAVEANEGTCQAEPEEVFASMADFYHRKDVYDPPEFGEHSSQGGAWQDVVGSMAAVMRHSQGLMIS